MKLIAKLLGLMLILLPLICIGTILLIVENDPKLQGWAEVTSERIARGKRIFEQNDPRKLRSGSIATVSLHQEDLDLAVNYFANQYVGALARLKIDNGRAVVDGTVKLPDNPLGRYLNITLEFEQTDRIPRLVFVKMGRLSLPGSIVEPILKSEWAGLETIVDWQSLNETIKQISFRPRHMTVTYQWQQNLPAKFSGVLLPPKEQQRMEAYQQRLSELAKSREKSMGLTALLQPLFRLAMTRSREGEAVAENRAAILVLAFYVNGKALHKLVAQPKSLPHPIRHRITLSGRNDFPKHYLVSAMLAAYAGTPLADAIGLYKEIEDSHGGSGFSFNDIAADRAGTRMGELAVAGETQAKKIQQLLVSAKESDIMPETSDLPEFMPAAEFQRRFGGTGGQAYREMMQRIEHRIAELPISGLM
ncbi:MAG: hypothetical protein ACU84J_04450 [Gammaproteobacteria bacterium]